MNIVVHKDSKTVVYEAKSYSLWRLPKNVLY